MFGYIYKCLSKKAARVSASQGVMTEENYQRAHPSEVGKPVLFALSIEIDQRWKKISDPELKSFFLKRVAFPNVLLLPNG